MSSVTEAAAGVATLDPPSADRGKPKRERKKSYGRTAKMGALWSMLRQGGNELISLPTSMIMARLLSPHDFGVAAASSFFITLASRLTQFGFGAALIRIKEMRPEHGSSIYLVNQGMGIVTFAVLFTLAPFMGRFFRSDEAGALIQLAAVSFLISPLGLVPSALFHRRMQFRYTVMTDWVDTIVGAVVTLICALRGLAYWSIVYGHLAGLVLRIVLQMFLARWTPRFAFSRIALQELLHFGLGIHTKRLLDYAAGNLDNLVVGRVLGMSALGIYNKAFTTMNKLVFRLTLGQAPFRIFSIIHEDRDRFARAYSRLILSITLLGYPVLTACIVVAKPMFLLLYGDTWLPAVFPFQLLCAGGMLKLLSAYASQANEAAGKIWRQTARQAVGVVLVVTGAAVGGSMWGVEGAAVGVLVAIVVVTVAMQSLVREATGLSWRELLVPQLPAILCAMQVALVLLATAAAFRAFVPDPPAWQMFVLQGTAGTASYAAFVLLAPIAAVRDIVTETVDELLPAGPARLLGRIRRLGGGRQR